MNRITLGFVISAIVAAVGTWYISETSCERAIKMNLQAQFAQAIGRANVAYRTESLAVAKWELAQFHALIQSGELAAYEDPDRLAFYDFLTTARLAKVYRELGEAREAQRYIENALEKAKPSYGVATNLETLFQLLAQHDTGTE